MTNKKVKPFLAALALCLSPGWIAACSSGDVTTPDHEEVVGSDDGGMDAFDGTDDTEVITGDDGGIEENGSESDVSDSTDAPPINCSDDSTIDTDNDGVCDTDDVCEGFDDNMDADLDLVPDGCDLCPGLDDSDAACIPHGVPQNGFPIWQERALHTAVNMARIDPIGFRDLYMNATDSSADHIMEAYPASDPLYYNYNLSAPARFHANQLALGCTSGHKSCDGTGA